MKVAVIGSRGGVIDNLRNYLPETITEIVSGGAKGIDSCAKKFAQENDIKLIEFLPLYSLYGKGAPIKRNELIVEYCDILIAFWDGQSKGTKFTIDYSKSKNKEVFVYKIKRN